MLALDLHVDELVDVLSLVQFVVASDKGVVVDVVLHTPHHPQGVSFEHTDHGLADERHIPMEVLTGVVALPATVLVCAEAKAENHVPPGEAHKCVAQVLMLFKPVRLVGDVLL